MPQSPAPQSPGGPDHAVPPAELAELGEPGPIGPATTPGPTAIRPARHPGAIPAGQAIPSHFRGCFGCGQDHATGLHVQAFAGEGLDLWARVQLTEDHQGAAGLGHGGVLAAIVDEAMGALHWLLLVAAVTARLEVEYLRPVPIGAPLLLRARVTGVAGRKVFTAAVLGAPGTPVLRASGLFVQVPNSHFRRYHRDLEPGAPGLELNP